MYKYLIKYNKFSTFVKYKYYIYVVICTFLFLCLYVYVKTSYVDKLLKTEKFEDITSFEQDSNVSYRTLLETVNNYYIYINPYYINSYGLQSGRFLHNKNNNISISEQVTDSNPYLFYISPNYYEPSDGIPRLIIQVSEPQSILTMVNLDPYTKTGNMELIEFDGSNSYGMSGRNPNLLILCDSTGTPFPSEPEKSSVYNDKKFTLCTYTNDPYILNVELKLSRKRDISPEYYALLTLFPMSAYNPTTTTTTTTQPLTTTTTTQPLTTTTTTQPETTTTQPLTTTTQPLTTTTQPETTTTQPETTTTQPPTTTTKPPTTTIAATTTKGFTTSTQPITTQELIRITQYTEPIVTKPIMSTVPQTTNPANLCNQRAAQVNQKTCNSINTCVYANSYCYNKTDDKIGFIDSTTIDCITNKNTDGTYNIILKASTIGYLFLIKRIDFVIKDLNNDGDNPFLSATFINLDPNYPSDKEKLYIINSNGSLEFKLKINNSNYANNYDFTSMVLKDINDRQITLSSANKLSNIIINKTTIEKARNTVNKIEYDNTFALKTKLLDTNIKSSLNKLL
jgi:hypothetical protein